MRSMVSQKNEKGKKQCNKQGDKRVKNGERKDKNG